MTEMKRHLPARRGFATGVPWVLAAMVTWAAVGLPGDTPNLTRAEPGADRNWAEAVAAASGDPIILAAIQTPANANRIMFGDAAAVAAFETARPPGALTALPATGDPLRGVYSPVIDWPLIGIHAVLTPDGRVLTYGTTITGTRTGYFVYDVWDPLLGVGIESHTVLPNATAVDIFCNAQLLLPDGNIEMWGGDVLNLSTGAASLDPNDDSALFRPLDNSLVRTGKMFRKRWYATSTTLPNGEVYIQGGDGGGDFPEVRTGTGSFRLLTGAPTTHLGALYPRNFLAPDGNVFGTRYEFMYRVDPNGVGTIASAGTFPGSNLGASSTAVMFRPGRILQVGGGYDLMSASPQARVIDIRPATPVVTSVAPPLHRRHWATSTMLPDGRVFLSGGSTADNNPINGVAYTSELYDPVANTWSAGATAQRMRLYHSAALLLPDASVLTLGGGANGPQLNLNAEIYYPGYLFNADGTPAARPAIASAPMTSDPGQTIAITTPDAAAIARVTLIKTGAVTHSFDMDQRFIELPFTVAGNELQASLPANAFETPPGFYMVFVVNGQGVPSEAAMLRVNTHVPARLTVSKIVVNDNGGGKVASNFAFSINGAPAVAFETDASNVLNVPAGTYTVTEPAVAGYTASLSGCGGIVLANGGSATCTITNNDVASALTATAGTSKPVYVRGETVTMTARVLNNGAPVSGARVSFDALKPNLINHVRLTAFTNSNGDASASFVSGTGPSSIGTYQLTALATSGSLTATAYASFVVQTSQAPQPATLTVRKVVVNNDGGSKLASDFTFSVNGAAPVAFESDGSNALSVPAGTYTVTEPAVAGYSASLSGCSGIVLAAGGSTTCTITNNDQPVQPATLTVRKVVVNNDGGSKLASDFTFSVNGAAPVAFESDGSNALSVPAGTYTVTEPAVAGYAASLSGCSGIVLAAGGFTTCTITNNDQPAQPATLTVRKVVVNNDGGSKLASDFTFSVNGAAPVAFESDGSNALSVPAGTYTVTEPAVAGYAASLSGCNSIVLAAGGSTTCTITNNDLSAALSATAGTSKPVYIRGETVTMTSRVLNNGVPVSGALVSFDALKPNLINHVRLSATTDGNGNASISFVSGVGPSSIGTYQLTVIATSGTLTATAFTTFVVQ
ncbi:galactose oxidase-like domain-containing protein [Montanilutibacter psychrotolerans]|uniref:DUF1929 domain-containing protein n=1 Tax=Montanilutibacter psychrotolerans TaxID=1327343 RepID=A0A3M8SS34_9GAMM|nr:galactose oxidase-like domain-containing protein [Lysobacter psychrotolerans]RNF82024.1 DUF1929 domain-containing protein [Lysobacter psychrotolerans]